MYPRVIPVYKNKGKTPLQTLENLAKDRPELKDLPLTYAGRLDPLAEGLLLVLVGDECKKKDEYLVLSKEYIVTILFGFETDTYDVMGRVTDAPSAELFERSSDLLAQKVKKVRGQTISNSSPDFASIVQNFTGTITQSYPPYSSRTVDGKPLFQWAREGKLDEITIPTHEVFIESIDVVDTSVIYGIQLQKKIHEDISLVKGDFRQEEILQLWDSTFENSQEIKFNTITLRVVCGSGAYMRTLAYDIGKMLGVPALALDIVRTKVGEYTI
jgi:tRNA pseudouridine55 synthase